MKNWHQFFSVAERHIIKWNSSVAKGAGFLSGGGGFFKKLQQFHIKNQSSVQFQVKQ
jgi:hypothetical protein